MLRPTSHGHKFGPLGKLRRARLQHRENRCLRAEEGVGHGPAFACKCLACEKHICLIASRTQLNYYGFE